MVRVHGPFEPEAGHRSAASCCSILTPGPRGKLTWDRAVFQIHDEAEGSDLTFDGATAPPFQLKSVIVDPNFDWRGEYRHETSLGEHHHLRDACQRLHAVADSTRSCERFYAGLGSKPVVDYLNRSASRRSN